MLCFREMLMTTGWVLQVLSTFDCTYKYSAHNCSACREAYKVWLCGMSFPACGPNNAYVWKWCYCDHVR